MISQEHIIETMKMMNEIVVIADFDENNHRPMTLDNYQILANSTAQYPSTYKVVYPALGLAGEAGEIANKVKKIIRDTNNIITEEKRKELKAEIGDVCWYIAALATDLGLSLDEIAKENIAKLKSRQERGVIKGDGDDR